MLFFFFLQFLTFFFSILVLNHWINQLILKRSGFDASSLPVFAWGWLIYFLIYIVSRWLAVPVEPIRAIFTGTAFSIAIAGGMLWFFQPHCSFWQQRKESLPLDLGTIAFLFCFFMAMLYIGPYLEHPSDSVDYFYRIQAWEKARFMNYFSENRYVTFATFYEHWLLQSSGLDYGERLGLTFVSALTQGLLLWEFIRITRLITHNIPLSLLSGLMSLGYLGYDAISFYRYSVFSGPMLSYLIYLEALVLIIALFLQEQWRYLLFGKPERKLDIMAGLTLFPFLVFCNPLAIEALRRVMAAEQFHRLIYGCLYWTLPILLLDHFAPQLEGFISQIVLFKKKRKNTIHPQYFIIILLLFASLISHDPIYGKMIHSWLKVPNTFEQDSVQVFQIKARESE